MTPSTRLRIAQVEVQRWTSHLSIGDETMADQTRRTIDDLVGYFEDGRLVWPPELGVKRPKDRKRGVA